MLYTERRGDLPRLKTLLKTRGVRAKEHYNKHLGRKVMMQEMEG